MGEWKQLGSKLAYMFGELIGWTPGADVISAVRGGVYNCQNIRFDEGKVKTRGGWAQFTTGDTDIRSIYGFRSAGDRRLVSVKQSDASNGDLRYYDFSTGAWADPDLLKRFMSTASQDYAVIPSSDGKDNLIITDGTNQNLKWNFESAAFELTSKLIFDGESGETWTFDAGGRVTGAVITGTYAITATDDSTAGDTSTITLGEDVYSVTPGSENDADVRIGDELNVERALAIKVELTEDTTFDTIQFQGVLDGTPSGNIVFQCETDSSGEPSGTLIVASASKTQAYPTADGWFSIVLDSGAITYNQPFWVTCNAPNQTAGEHIRLVHRAVTWGSGLTSNVLVSDDDGSSWSSNNSVVNVKLTSASDYFDLGTEYSDGDEIVLWARLDDTYTDISAANSNITFTDSADVTMKFVFTNQTFTAGTWVQWTIARESSTTGDWTETGGDFDWTAVKSVAITVTDGGSDVLMQFDSCYIRKSRVDNTSVGSQERPFIAKYCEPSPYGDRILLANTEVTGGEDNSGPQYLWYSDSYNIDSFTSTNWLAFPEAITGIKTSGGLTHVFSYNNRWIMEANYGSSDVSTGALDFAIAKARGPGCVSNRSIAEGVYNNEHGVFFLSQNGVYFTNGMEAIRVSGDIDILFQKKYSASDLFYADSFDETNWGFAAAVWYRDRYYLSYYGRGDTDNQATIILNTKTGTWERDVLGGSVFPVMYAVSEDSSGVPVLYCCADNGEVYYLVENRTTVTDDGNAYQSDFQTTFIGTELMREVEWETLNIWVRSMTTSATSLIVKVFTIEDYDDTTSYDEWEEDPDTAIATITTAWTPNTEFKWHRLRIKLDDNTNNVYPKSRAISLQIYDDNDTAVDFFLESLIATPLHDELR